MPLEIRPVTAAILNFNMAAFSHIQPLQLVIGLQCKAPPGRMASDAT